MSYEIINKCGTKCLIKSDEPHRIIGTVNDEVAAVITDALAFKDCYAMSRTDEHKALLTEFLEFKKNQGKEAGAISCANCGATTKQDNEQ